MVPCATNLRNGLPKRRNRKSRAYQRGHIVFQGLRPSDEVHLQSVTLLHALKAFPAEIGVMEDKRGIRLRVSETAAIREGVHDRDNEVPEACRTRRISLSEFGTSATSINTLYAIIRSKWLSWNGRLVAGATL